MGRFVAGRPTEATEGVPRLLPWPRLRAVTRWLSPLLGLALVAVSGLVFQTFQPASPRTDLALAGVYRVVEDSRPPAARLVDDGRWQSVAFGQWTYAGPPIPIPGYPEPGSARMAIRAANGDLVIGRYTPVRDGVVRVQLRPSLSGSTAMLEPAERTVELSWAMRPDGRVSLTGDGQDLVLESDPELRFLSDRGFSWDLGDDAAVNR